jgi:hypothetical protein
MSDLIGRIERLEHRLEHRLEQMVDIKHQPTPEQKHKGYKVYYYRHGYVCSVCYNDWEKGQCSV